jgi:hypothetical protein
MQYGEPHGSTETPAHVIAELAEPTRAVPPVRRVGRLRLPIAGPYRPWATLYVLPDGRRYWLVRLWEVDRVRVRCVPTRVLRSYARINQLPALDAEISALEARAGAPDVGV